MQLKNHNRSKCNFSKDRTEGDDCKQSCELLFLCLLLEMMLVNMESAQQKQKANMKEMPLEDTLSVAHHLLRCPDPLFFPGILSRGFELERLR